MMSPVAHAGSGESARVTQIGQVVDNRYQLLRLLGSGGMGTVYEARHLRIGRRFAVKFLHADLTTRLEVLARFQREALVAGTLDTEHVVEVTDFGATEDGSPYLVMEYLSGEDAAQLLAREGPLPVTRAVKIALDVCRGLAVAHAAGIVHRDLKPANLFLAHRADGSEVTKILDFGIAKQQPTSAEGSVTATGATLGTPYYMAPEQVRDTKDVDCRADLHALGVVLYELLSGHKPHPGQTHNAIVAHILTEQPIDLACLREGLPEGLVRLVHRAMAVRPADRYQTAAELARELSAFAGQEILQVDSQLELRNETTGGTSPSDEQCVSGSFLPGERSTPRGRWQSSRFATALVVGGLALASGIVGWHLNRYAATPYPPRPTPEPAVTAVSSSSSKTPVLVEVVPNESAVLPSGPGPSDERGSRPPRISVFAARLPSGSRIERATIGLDGAPAQTATRPSGQSVVDSTGSAPEPGRRRVSIDANNPYD